VFSKTTEGAITALASQLAANAGAEVSPRGLAELTLRHFRSGGLADACVEIEALIHKHGYWEVETAAVRLLERE
jgi:hypothetical protein